MTLKNYIGISRDHSSSMSSIAQAAMSDYNSNVDSIREASITENLDTVVSVVECRSNVTTDVINSSVHSLKKLTQYHTSGMTALFDSVGKLIELAEQVPDYNDPNVSFLIMAITDGEENQSIKWRSRLRAKIVELQNTGRWTFAFRVPRGSKRTLASLGIPEGNILEWETTERGFAQATVATTSAVSSYYSNLSRGVQSTDKFFADLSQVSTTQIKQTLYPLKPNEYTLFTAQKTDDIKNTIENYLHKTYKTGSTFYELTKTETVQKQKKIAIRDKTSGELYTGANARYLLGLPSDHQIKLVPTKHSKYDVFVQSTSVNRKIPQSSLVLHLNQR
jgi:hypothetical protein